MKISFFSEDCTFRLLGKMKKRAWIESAVVAEGKRLGVLNIIFCSDEYLLQMNRQYLEHDYLTDIITFDYCEDAGAVCGDLFISVPMVERNAVDFGVCFEDELDRVMIHGVLHLMGYDDHCPSDIQTMRGKENFYLKCRNTM